MRKLLIVGASVLQLPAIKKAKEMGFYVGVIDYDPHAVGIPFADEYFNVSTNDIEGVACTAEQFHPDGVFTLATDMPMRSIAEACRRCGLPGITMETAVRATDKGEMIRAFARHEVPHPWFFLLSSADELPKVAQQVTYPCISKPVDSSGSRGIMLIRSPEELPAAVEYSASRGRNGGVVVEEYLMGQEVSVEVIVVRGEAHILQVTDKLTTGAPHFVEMGHSQPSRLPEKALEEIRRVAARAVNAVGIENGPAHVEMMLTESGPRMIELGARMGGDCITTHLVPLSTGIDMTRAAIRLCCGEEPDLTPRQNQGAAIRYFQVPYGRIASIEGTEQAASIPGVQEITFTKQVGDIAGEIGSSTDRIGFVIAQAATAAQAVEACEQAMAAVTIRIEPTV